MEKSNITIRQLKIKKDYTKQKCIILCILVGLVLLAAVFAEYIVPYDPYAQDLSNALLPPGGKHLLGTDRYGRDMLSRVIIRLRHKDIVKITQAAESLREAPWSSG